VLRRPSWHGWALAAAWERGKGRVLAIGTDTTWRWALGSATPEFYNAFWKNVVRYLAHSGESKRLRVIFDRAEYYEGPGA
jgi:hypothetical protein